MCMICSMLFYFVFTFKNVTTIKKKEENITKISLWLIQRTWRNEGLEKNGHVASENKVWF